MHELPTTARKDIIPYAKLNKMTWYFSGISVFVRSAALPVPFIADIFVGEVIVVVKILSVYNGLILLVNNENVVESIEVHHSVKVNLDILFIWISKLWIIHESKTS